MSSDDVPNPPSQRRLHRRELSSAVSSDAGQFPSIAGPDGVPVTVRVEPAVDRLLRWRNATAAPAVITDPIGTYVGYRVLPGLVQRYLLRDRWAVVVEADNGDSTRVPAGSREEAITYANRIAEGVRAQGAAFIRTFAG